MRAIIGVGAEKRESYSFVSRSCRLLRPIWHLHNQPLMRASRPFFITLASIEHAEPTVYAICRPDVSGSLGVGIMLRSSHRVIRQNFQPSTRNQS